MLDSRCIVEGKCFFWNSTGALYGDLEGQMYPAWRSSFCLLSSSSSGVVIQYRAKVGGLAPCSNLIAWSTSLLGGSFLGSSAGITSLKSSSTSWMALGAWISLASSSNLREARKVGSFLRHAYGMEWERHERDLNRTDCEPKSTRIDHLAYKYDIFHF